MLMLYCIICSMLEKIILKVSLGTLFQLPLENLNRFFVFYRAACNADAV